MALSNLTFPIFVPKIFMLRLALLEEIAPEDLALRMEISVAEKPHLISMAVSQSTGVI